MAFLRDNGGVVVEKYTYDVFGRPKITADGQGEHSYSYYGHRFLFQGREYLYELGLSDYRHRMYHPGLGRFLQTDPKGFDAGDMNLSRYCGDDPVDGSDPLGLTDINKIPSYDFGNWFGAVVGREHYRLFEPKQLIVSAHGTTQYIVNKNVTHEAWNAFNSQAKTPIPTSMQLPVSQLIADIKANKNYDKTIPVKLDICFAGDFQGAAKAKMTSALAQQVANGLPNPVIANTHMVNPYDGKGQGTDITFYGPESGRTTELSKSVKAPRTLGGPATGSLQSSAASAYGQSSNLISTGGGGLATAGYFPGGGEEGEGFHPVPNKQ